LKALNFIYEPVCFKHLIRFYFLLAMPVKTSLLSFQVTVQKQNEYIDGQTKSLGSCPVTQGV